MRLLLVEDDPDLGEILRAGLAEEGYAVDLSANGEEGLWRATTVDYDVAVLDVMLPDVSGLEILRRMRAERKATPVLFLTARDGTDDRVAGLDAGADDYLVKPFAWEELLARIRALLRRGPQGAEGPLRNGDLVLDPAARTVRLGGEDVVLTAKEFEILWVLLREPGRALTRTEIEASVYDDGHDGASNTVDVLIGRIRRKLSRDGEPPWIETVRGVGYAARRAGER